MLTPILAESRTVQLGEVPLMTPILPEEELEVKFKGDLLYLFQSPKYNGFVLTFTCPEADFLTLNSSQM